MDNTINILFSPYTYVWFNTPHAVQTFNNFRFGWKNNATNSVGTSFIDYILLYK
jgi:hypothetical protein